MACAGAVEGRRQRASLPSPLLLDAWGGTAEPQLGGAVPPCGPLNMSYWLDAETPPLIFPPPFLIRPRCVPLAPRQAIGQPYSPPDWPTAQPPPHNA